MTSNAIRVLVVDDSAFFRKVLTTEIASKPGFQVVGTAGNGREAIAKVKELRPDVVTLDVEMPVMSGIDALRVIKAESNASVIMVSAQTESGAKVTLQALELGAIDFIPKTRGASFIHEKLKAAADARRSRVTPALRQPAPVGRVVATKVAAAPVNIVRKDAKLVVVGSSTGGPQALVTLFGALPRNLPVPIVVAQHMPPHFTEALANRLNENSRLNVVHAKDGDKLMPGTVYIAPGGSTMRVKPGEISVAFNDDANLYKPSVDVLAQSALAAYGKHVIGVLLTGMGADGAKELNNLHKAGGYTLAQDQHSCVVYGMPRALAEMGGADEVLSLDEISGRLEGLLGCAPRSGRAA